MRNANEQANREISNRFDYKGSDTRDEQSDGELTLFADDDIKLGQVTDVQLAKCAKRNVDVRYLDFGDKQKVGGDKMKQPAKIRSGIATTDAKRIVKLIKESKMKVQASIQGDSVRVTGNKRDLLQEAIALLKKEVTDLPLGFENFRD